MLVVTITISNGFIVMSTLTYYLKIVLYTGLRICLILIPYAVISYSFSTPIMYEQAITQPIPTTDTHLLVPEWVPELPVRLLIPAINVDAAIQSVGLAADGSGEMAAPSNLTDISWYQPGVRPGMPGSAVMAGHYSNGGKSSQAVFYDLGALRIGDEVMVMSAERIEDIFRVVRVEIYDYDAPTTEIFHSDDGKARLNLITCGGTWLPALGMYEKRIVVFTIQVTNVE